MVFQLQFTLLEALELELVVSRIASQGIDDGIEVTMLNFQFNNAPLDLFDRIHKWIFYRQALKCRSDTRFSPSPNNNSGIKTAFSSLEKENRTTNWLLKLLTIKKIDIPIPRNKPHAIINEVLAATQFNRIGSMSQYKIEAGTAQHIGDRDEQQDRAALLVAPKAPGYVMAVLADGMGGLSGGALAAEQVIRTAKQNFERFSPLTDTVPAMLETIAKEAHTLIKLTQMASSKEPHSTVVALILTPDKTAFWTHVGDSRLYRFDGPNFAERTIDHSYVEKLVAEGKVTPEEAKKHRLANVLTRALGIDDQELEVSVRRYDGLKTGDAFLLCSDGLWRYFSDRELGAAIAMNSPRQAAEMLINKARERATGTEADNCTMAIIKLAKPAEEVKDYKVKTMRRAV